MAKGKKKIHNNTKGLIGSIVEAIQEKKGHHLTLINFDKIENRVFDYFIICHGNSRVQVEAIFESVDRHVKTAHGIDPYHKEGLDNAEWVLIDYVDVVVHIFQEKSRQFYKLESLWADAEITKFE